MSTMSTIRRSKMSSRRRMFESDTLHRPGGLALRGPALAVLFTLALGLIPGLVLRASPPASATGIAAAEAAADPVAFLVLAPDRGFLGNEEVRESFAPFADRHPARLLFVTDERTREGLAVAFDELRASGAGEVVVLPFFVAPSSPRLGLARDLVDELGPPEVAVRWARPYGASYLAVEALAEDFREGLGGGHPGADDSENQGHGEPDHGAPSLVVVGSGARDEASLEALRSDWRRLALWAVEGLEVASVEVAVAPDRDLENRDLHRQLQERFEEDLSAAGALVVPFHQGSKYDGMMSLTAALPRTLPEGARVVGSGVTPDPTVGLWMEREANRHSVRSVEELGVVALAHGSDYHWNETMRRAVAPLAARYTVVPSFSMADRNLMERALRDLEDRGVGAAVVVRIFGLASSFRGSVERMLGQDVEAPGATLAEPPEVGAAAQGHGHGHGAPPPRIRTSLVVATVGGLEDHPLFARALYDRALEISEDPGRETLLLVAHGRGDDAADAHWQGILDSLAAQIRELGGDRFRAVEGITWREDWPEKREPRVERARRLVREATEDGGRALVVPARTTGQGSAEEFLEGLDFRFGRGFAPHELFPEWIHAQVLEGVEELGLAPRAEERLRASLEDLAGGAPAGGEATASSSPRKPSGGFGVQAEP